MLKARIDLRELLLLQIGIIVLYHGKNIIQISSISAFNALPAAQSVDTANAVQVARRDIDRRWRGRHWRGRHWHGGRYWRGGYYRWRPGYVVPVGFYWSSWRPHSRYCSKRCLVDRRTGRIIRCKVRCR